MLTLVALVCAAAALSLAAAQSGGYFDSKQSPPVLLVAFGDSLSDVGNMYKATLGLIPRSPYYWQGRFTSAPGNWQDHINGLNTSTVKSINRAVGGSKACRKTSWSVTTLIPTALDQARIFNLDVSINSNSTLLATLANKTVVPLIWAGHNDLLDMPNLSASELEALPDSVATCIFRSAELLLNSQVAPPYLIVGTLAPLELTPAMRGNKTAASVVDALNALIRQGVADLQANLDAAQRNQTVLLWDAHDNLADIILTYAQHGFVYNNSRQCLLYKPGDDITKGSLPYYACSDPNSYIFQDDVHPTSLAHLYVSEDILATLARGGALPSSVLPPARRRMHDAWRRHRSAARRQRRRRRVLRHSSLLKS